MRGPLHMQCADYFPERLGESVAAGGWRVSCSAVQDVDADVCRRDLTLTPPPKQVSFPPCRPWHSFPGASSLGDAMPKPS